MKINIKRNCFSNIKFPIFSKKHLVVALSIYVLVCYPIWQRISNYRTLHLIPMKLPIISNQILICFIGYLKSCFSYIFFKIKFVNFEIQHYIFLCLRIRENIKKDCKKKIYKNSKICNPDTFNNI